MEEREKQANFQALMAARDGDADQVWRRFAPNARNRNGSGVFVGFGRFMFKGFSG